MATKILTAAALVLGLSFSSVAFAGTPKTDAKTDAKAPVKVEAKTTTANDVTNSTTLVDVYYWYDAQTHQLISSTPTESAGCPGGNQDCAYGYKPSDFPNGVPQQKPSQGADKTEKIMP